MASAALIPARPGNGNEFFPASMAFGICYSGVFLLKTAYQVNIITLLCFYTARAIMQECRDTCLWSMFAFLIMKNRYLKHSACSMVIFVEHPMPCGPSRAMGKDNYKINGAAH
jgi:hypothetical protein